MIMVESGPDSLALASPAKLNLTLRVGPLRSDGFHDIESLVAFVDLCDTLVAELLPSDALELTCDDPTIPTDDRNLVLKAVGVLRRAAGGNHRGVRFGLGKRIPSGGGLGGGSGNAAAALLLLNELWGLRWPRARLAELAADVGSDVACFLYQPLCAMSGRGEWVTAIDAEIDGAVALFIPEIGCDTAVVYRQFDQLPPNDDEQRVPLPELGSGSVVALAEQCFNDLQPAAFSAYPALAACHARLEARLQTPVLLSGSGSTMFALCADLDAARRMCDTVAGLDGFRSAAHRLVGRTTDSGLQMVHRTGGNAGKPV